MSIEYGEINLNGVNDTEDTGPTVVCGLSPAEEKLVKGFVSTMCGGMGLAAILGGAVVPGVFFFGLIPYLWAEELDRIIKKIRLSSQRKSFKNRVLLLANQLGQLPPPKLADYDPKYYSEVNMLELYNYMDTALGGSSWLKSVALLQDIDPRIELCTNADAVTSSEKIPIVVNVHDTAWMGQPSCNTMITGVNADVKAELKQEIEMQNFVVVESL